MHKANKIIRHILVRHFISGFIKTIQCQYYTVHLQLSTALNGIQNSLKQTVLICFIIHQMTNYIIDNYTPMVLHWSRVDARRKNISPSYGAQIGHIPPYQSCRQLIKCTKQFPQ